MSSPSKKMVVSAGRAAAGPVPCSGQLGDVDDWRVDKAPGGGDIESVNSQPVPELPPGAVQNQGPGIPPARILPPAAASANVMPVVRDPPPPLPPQPMLQNGLVTITGSSSSPSPSGSEEKDDTSRKRRRRRRRRARPWSTPMVSIAVVGVLLVLVIAGVIGFVYRKKQKAKAAVNVVVPAADPNAAPGAAADAPAFA